MNGNGPLPVASPYKVAAHGGKVAAFLRGEGIFPVTLELDLTSRCSRSCSDCPSTRASSHWQLDLPFLQRLFALLSGNVSGLLLTGGETTLSPHFPETLALARQSGIAEIAVVTNGSRLDAGPVADALLEFADTIRLSLYDWESGASGCEAPSLDRLEKLRRRIDDTASPLRAGVSLLTSTPRLPLMETLVRRIAAAGAHWIYFHPRCRNWQDGRPVPEQQQGVLAEIGRLAGLLADRVEIHVFPQRYEDARLSFSAYHAAHFMMVVGADRKNYLGAEVKYNPDFVIADLADGVARGFLWSEERFRRIASFGHDAYSAVGSRHRGVLYSDYLERLLRSDPEAEEVLRHPPSLRFPHIL